MLAVASAWPRLPGDVWLRILPVGVAAAADPRQSIWLDPFVVPARERWIDVSVQHHDLPTDREGRVRLDPAPTAPFSVWTRAKGVNAARARQLAAGDMAALRDSAVPIATDLRLPPAVRSVTIELRIPPGR